jgi:prolyl-tRNA synthetase
MGGTGSIEFMVPSPAGEDDVVRCPGCDYAANVERATAAVEPISDEPGPAAPVRFPTPGVRTIAALEQIDGGAPADRQLKTMVMVLDGAITLAVIRGDHQLNVQKLQDATGAAEVRPATAAETQANLGANPGSLGAVGVDGVRVIVDESLRGRTNLTTGANEDDWHLSGVDVARDIPIDDWADLREVRAGEACVACGSALEVVRCIEAGHIFKLGRRYSEPLGAHVLDPDGVKRALVMGSYGIGIGRAMAAIAETFHDDNGLVWPLAVAPFEVVITIANVADDAALAAGETLYDDLRRRDVDVILDDRDARAGVKFADSELVGIPWRVTIGKALADGEVELTDRGTGETRRVEVGTVAEMVANTIAAAS